MNRTRAAILLLTLGCSVAAFAFVGCSRPTPPTPASASPSAPLPDKPLTKSEVKQLVEKIGRATLAGDMDTVIDSTYPAIIDAIGGRKKMVVTMEKIAKDMKANGLAFASYDVGEPGDFQTEGGNTFTVVPSKLEITGADTKMVIDSFLLGISPNGGRSWTFIDGGGLKDKKVADKVLPKLPAGLRLPQVNEPKLMPK